MAERYFLIKVPVNIADAYLTFRAVDGIHLLRFSAFECSGYEVGLDDVDDPIDCEDYLIEREFQRLKRRYLTPTEHPFSHMWGYTDFYKPACPSHFVGGRIPLHPSSISPSERWVPSPLMLPFRAWGRHMHSDRHINRWSVRPSHGSPPPQCPFDRSIPFPS